MNETSASPTPAAPPLPQPDVGKRVGAAVIDLFILTIWIVVFSVIFGETKKGSDEADGFSINISGLPFIVLFLSCYLYYGLLEAFWNGQTLGKR
jgi:uncharacterized RDD family membrane protein YckC